MNNLNNPIMDETTRLINDENSGKGNAQQPQVAETKVSKGNGNSMAAATAGGFMAGAIGGAGSNAMMARAADVHDVADMPVEVEAATDQQEASAPEEHVDAADAKVATQEAMPVANETKPTLDVEVEVPSPESVILANDEGIRYAHVDADSFGEAFAQARAQVGPGGVFEYNGKVYSTYIKEEWDAMSQEERVEYQHRVFNTNPAQPDHVTATDNHELTACDSGDMIADEPADNEVRVLRVEAVTNEDGNTMNVAVVESGNEQALLVDIDGDGMMDVIVHDDNGDGVIQDNEVHDFADAGVGVDDLLRAQAAQNGDLFYASNDDMPDYVNDADAVMMV